MAYQYFTGKSFRYIIYEAVHQRRRAMTVAWVVCHTGKPTEQKAVPEQVLESFKRCEACGKKVGVPWRIIDGLYFCRKTCYLRYFGG